MLEIRFGEFQLIDLLLNLIAEAIGLIVGLIATYLIIDRLLEKREHRRWIPSKNLLYAKLFDATEKFLSRPFGSLIGIGSESKVFTYGAAHVFGYGNYEQYDKVNSVFHFIELAKGHKILNEEFDRVSIEELQRQLNTLLGVYTPLFEPELMALVIELENNIVSFSMLKKAFDEPFAFGIFYSRIIEAAIAVRLYLESKSDTHMTGKEFMKKNREVTEALKKNLNAFSSLEGETSNNSFNASGD